MEFEVLFILLRNVMKMCCLIWISVRCLLVFVVVIVDLILAFLLFCCLVNCVGPFLGINDFFAYSCLSWNISFAFIGQQVLLVISNRLKIKARRLKILIFLHLRLLTYFKFADFLFGFFVLTFLKLAQFLPYQ